MTEQPINLSLVIPVYKNEANIPPLVLALEGVAKTLGPSFEVVFVVDGSPDGSEAALQLHLAGSAFSSQLISLSRNFGSFAAIRAGLAVSRGSFLAVMAADLQEPPELIVEFFRHLSLGTCDVVVGQRLAREDGAVSSLSSSLFWSLYKWIINPEIPSGGVDVFGCNEAVRAQILSLRESNSSLVGLLFWVGFRRLAVPYERKKREIGRSAWSFSRKLRYLSDSVYGFTDLPIRMLSRIGVVGMTTAIVLAIVVLIRKLGSGIPVPGYTPTVLLLTFFGGLNCFGLGILGSYVWRAFENTKARPPYIVASTHQFEPAARIKDLGV